MCKKVSQAWGKSRRESWGVSYMAPNILLNCPRSRPPDDGAYAPDANLQWWYFDAVLDSGHRFLTFFLPRFLGSLKGNEPDVPFLDIVLRMPTGETVREQRYFRRVELVAARGRLDATFGTDCCLRYEKGRGEGDFGRYLIKGRAGRLGYDLQLEPDMPPWTPTGRKGRFPHPLIMLLRHSAARRDYFHYVPLVPRGRLGGQITLDGRTINAKGTGYHEQGRLNFDLANFVPIWYWLHIEHPPWTILSGTASLPPWIPNLKDPAPGGIAYVRKGDTCLMAAFDVSGIFVDWTRVKKRDPDAQGERSMAWESSVRFMRPGLRVKAELVSTDVLEYVPFEYHDQTPARPYWGQTVAEADVEILNGLKRTRFRAEGVLETMVTGSPQKL